MSLTKYFEYEFYISHYSELKTLSKNKAINHFLNIGSKELKIFNKKLINLDYEYFVKNYTIEYNSINEKDKYIFLDKNFIKICNYFIENVNNNLLIYNYKLLFFDYNYYITKYSDLKKFNYFEATEHFLTYGFKENRLFNKILENYDNDECSYENFYNFIIDTSIKPNKCIILDSYINYGLKTHTDILYNAFNYDVCVVNYKNENNKYKIEYYKDIKDKIHNYSLLIFQHTTSNLPHKKDYQKFIYVVHCKISTMNYRSYKSFIDKLEYIDYYVFVSEEVKEDYINTINRILNIKNPQFENYCVIENTLPKIENNIKTIKNLYICGSSYTPHKNIIELIIDFVRFANNKNSSDKKILKIFGDKSNNLYFKEVQKILKNCENEYLKINDTEINNTWEVHLNDALETNEYLEILKSCEYYCMYSNGEGNSYAILEAMMLNKKIICSESCITTETGKEYKDKRFKFEDFDSSDDLFILEHNSIEKFKKLFNDLQN